MAKITVRDLQPDDPVLREGLVRHSLPFGPQVAGIQDRYANRYGRTINPGQRKTI